MSLLSLKDKEIAMPAKKKTSKNAVKKASKKTSKKVPKKSSKKAEKRNDIPPQHQTKHPGEESKMTPKPEYDDKQYKGADKLKGKVALITGGDSGIGRATAVLFAREGADVSIVYYDEDEDAKKTKKLVEDEGGKCILISGDIKDEEFCIEAVEKTVNELGKLDILVNNAAVQYVQENIEDISSRQLEKTYQTNIFSFFYFTKAALKHMKEGSKIINTASITAYHGRPDLIDYSSTKGAIVAFTRSLSRNLNKRGIRVNAVAPGPIWTPLIPSSFDEKKVDEFGEDTPMGRPGQPEEIAPCYVFLASPESSYITGQVLHPNGGYIVNT
jgi:NAD(P)-dependent dehydrogenase (short-subunit alcohol dehydrogenase family)